MFSVKVTGADLRDVSRKLRKVNDANVKRRFRKELRIVASPFVPAVRNSIAAIPTTGSQSTGLRSRLQKAVTLRIRTSGKNASVSILMSTGKMPDGQKALPAYMEGVKSPWRHPVFGREDEPWAEQPAHPYFFPVVRSMGAAGKRAASRVVDQITRAIT
jgi:hypothetical protein